MPSLARLVLWAAGLGITPTVASPAQQVLAIPAERIETGSKPSHKLHGRFLHITDFHPDELYKTHTSTASGIACHRKSGAAGIFGAETSDCDSPISLVNATFNWIANNLKDELDFVIWTGDSARHDSDEKLPRTKDQVIGTNKLLAQKFAETFVDGMSIPVIPTFGNNDILPHNILLPGPNKWLGYYAKIWKTFIPEEQRHSFEHGGWFYVEVVPKKLAVFSLNTLYFFDRNAGVDDCVRHSEPGYQQMEWLRAHLDMFRKNGMKAILMGHVPPARTDSKQNWDETCWQRYTLWLRQYRDVISGAVYGHMNIDHFMLQDTNDIDLGKMTVDWAKMHSKYKRKKASVEGNSSFGIQSASDYLHELRTDWSKLPNPSVKAMGEVGESSEDNLAEGAEYDNEYDWEEEDGVRTSRKKKRKKSKHPPKKLGGKWAERYQLSMIGPSIVPNYFPTIRVMEYNITGLEGHVTWADALTNSELFSDAADLFNLNYDEDEEEAILEAEANELEAESRKKKKKKKGKKGRKPDPNFQMPSAPAKTSPPGPAYSPQTLTLTGYTQYYANLTWLNNDMTEPGEKPVGPERWRDGIHKDKDPKHSRPRPREFEFEVEYSTFDDKTYRLKDLTVKSMMHLAYRIGKEKKGKKGEGKGLVESFNGVEFDENDDFEYGDGDDGESGSGEEDGLETEIKKGTGEDEGDGDNKKKKKKKKKGKKDKHEEHPTNKVWIQFLRRAFISTLPRDKLKKYAAVEADIMDVVFEGGEQEEQAIEEVEQVEQVVEQVVFDEL